jgi:hypothetical protein
MMCRSRHQTWRTMSDQRATDGLSQGLSPACHPQARRLRRPAARLRGLTAACRREDGRDAVDGGICRSLPIGGAPDPRIVCQVQSRSLPMMQWEHLGEATTGASGAFLYEAIRSLIQIVGAPEKPARSRW